MTARSAPAHGLSTLSAVPLSPEREAQLRALAAHCQGSPPWRARKPLEARDLFALEALAPRVNVLALDLATELLAVLRLEQPVPCMRPDGELVIATSVEIALRCTEEILRRPLPGHALVQITAPRGVWHPNVSRGLVQRLCLGANVPRGYPLREAVLGAYAALTLQSISLDRADPAGIMNPEALAFWNDHRARIPLSRAAFLDAPGPAQPEEAP